MPDLSPSLGLLKKFIPQDSGDTSAQDEAARQEQSKSPLWQQYGRSAIDALANVPKGILGIDPRKDESNAGYVANALMQLYGAAAPMMGMATPPSRNLSEGLNASGESAASLEALSRMSSMKNKAEQFVVYRGGQKFPLIGPDAVDYKVRPGELYGVEGPNGFRLLDRK